MRPRTLHRVRSSLLLVIVAFAAILAAVLWVDYILDRQDITKIERAFIVGARSPLYGILVL